MIGACHEIERIVLKRIVRTGKAVEYGQDASAGPIHDLRFDSALLDSRHEVFAKNARFRVLDVEAGGGAIDLAHAQHPIGMDKPLKTPFVPQDICQKLPVLTAIFPIHLVVGAHHGRAARVQGPLEMGQIDLPQCARINLHVHLEAGIFHGIQGEMLDRRNDIVGLNALRERGAHLAHMVGVFPVGLLGAPPGGMPQQVDADRAREGAALGPCLDPHDFADATLEIRIETGAPGHGDRKARGIATGDTPRAIGEIERGNAKTLASPAGSVRVGTPSAFTFRDLCKKSDAGHHGDFFNQSGFGQNPVDKGTDLFVGKTFFRNEIGHAPCPLPYVRQAHR